jgi:uncharacterized membrane protein
VALLILAGILSFVLKPEVPEYGPVWAKADHNTTGLVADAGENQSVSVGTEVEFNATGSTPDMDYSWWFHYGDGNVTLNGSVAEFTFDKPGSYVVTLVVSQGNTSWVTDTVIITVEPKTFVEQYWLVMIIGAFVAIMLVQYISVLRKARFVSPKVVAMYGVFGALTAAITMSTVIPFAPTKGYFNLGDAVVFFSALTFGWRAGAVCGGFGSAAADILLGSGYFAPLTLVAKGSEGLVSGFIGRLGGGRKLSIVAGIVAGGTCMVATYFLGELFLLNVGLGAALLESVGNTFQVVVGGTLGSLLSVYVKKSYPSISSAQE